MKTARPTARCAAIALLALTAASLARADVCDVLHVMNNEEGALRLPTAYFGGSDAEANALRAIVQPGGACQNHIQVTTMSEAITSDVGDGNVGRRIDLVSYPGSVNQHIPELGYRESFSVTPPVLTAATQEQSLVFGEYLFTSADVTLEPEVPGRLRFTLTTLDGKSWNLRGSLHYWAGSSFIETVVVSLTQPSTGQGSNRPTSWVPPKFYVDLEYRQYFQPPPAQGYVPKLRVRLMRTDGSEASNVVHTLPQLMAPYRRTQGLLEQGNLPTGELFELVNCRNDGC